MDHLDLLPFRATRDPAWAFVRIEVVPLQIVMAAVVQSALSSAQLGQFVRETARTGILLDLSTDSSFDVPTVEWMTHQWTAMLRQAGVQRLAVVLADTQAPLAGYLQRSTQMEVRAFPVVQSAAAHAFAAGPQAMVPAQPIAPSLANEQEVLALPPGAWSFAGGWGFFTGALLGCTAAALAEIGLGSQPEAFGAIGGAVVGSMLAVGSVFLVHTLRNSPAGKLTWDARGMTEWVGNKQTAFVPWEHARYSLLQSNLVYRSRGVETGRSTGRTLQLWDGGAQRITICDGNQRPRWLGNRPAQVRSIDRYLPMVKTPAHPMTVVPDALGYGRGGLWGFGLLALLAYAGIVGGAAYDNWNHSYASDQALAGIMVCGGSFLFACRMIWPATRLGTRLFLSSIVELALRSIVLLVFVALGIGLMLTSD